MPTTASNGKAWNSAPPTSRNCGPISVPAAEGAQALFSRCRLRKDIGDAREFWLAIAYVLDQYDPEIIRHVTDPFTGLPGRLRYPLEIADVRSACEAAVIFSGLYDEDRREARRAAEKQEAEQEAAELAETRQREAERARAEPVWPPIAAKLRSALTPATFKGAFANASLGTFSEGNLEIVVPPGASELASQNRARILHWVQELFPAVVAVRFVEQPPLG
jgi:hypothetical protein